MVDSKDAVSWSLDLEKGFLVSSCYARYVILRLLFGLLNRCEAALGIVWNMLVPFKIKVFGLRLFVNRLPSKGLLVNRSINFPLVNLKCVFCDLHLENRDHIFFNCNVIKRVDCGGGGVPYEFYGMVPRFVE